MVLTVKLGTRLEIISIVIVLGLWSYAGYQLQAFGKVDIYAWSGLVASLLVILLVLQYRIKDVLRMEVSSSVLIRLTLIIVIFGLASSAAYIGYFHLGVTDTAAVLTIIAEGLGFTGLSLVELTVFLRTKEEKERVRPKLLFEYDPQGNHDEFSPEIPFYQRNTTTGILISTSTRKFLRIRVKNIGEGIAKNCRGTVQFLGSRSGCQGPSKERKPLRWELGGTRQTIPPRLGAEILIVAFSDSHPLLVQDLRCGLLNEGRPGPTYMVAYLAHPDNISNFTPRLSDGFCYGDFEILITVICDEGVQEQAKFLLHVRSAWGDLSMERIS